MAVSRRALVCGPQVHAVSAATAVMRRALLKSWRATRTSHAHNGVLAVASSTMPPVRRLSSLGHSEHHIGSRTAHLTHRDRGRST